MPKRLIIITIVSIFFVLHLFVAYLVHVCFNNISYNVFFPGNDHLFFLCISIAATGKYPNFVVCILFIVCFCVDYKN